MVRKSENPLVMGAAGLCPIQVVKSSATEAGAAFLRAAVSRGNVALVERVAGLMGKKVIYQ